MNKKMVLVFLVGLMGITAMMAAAGTGDSANKTVVPAMAPPDFVLTLPSYSKTMAMAQKLVNAVNPESGMGAMLPFLLVNKLALTPENRNLNGLDQQAPIVLRMSLNEENKLLAALYIPVSDYVAFRKGLAPHSPLLAEDLVMQSSSGHAILWKKEQADQKLFMDWANSDSPHPTEKIMFRVNSGIIVKMLDAGKQMLQTLMFMQSQGGGASGIGSVVSMLDSFDGAIDHVEIGLGANDAELELSGALQPLAGSKFAELFAGPAPKLEGLKGLSVGQPITEFRGTFNMAPETIKNIAGLYKGIYTPILGDKAAEALVEGSSDLVVAMMPASIYTSIEKSSGTSLPVWTQIIHHPGLSAKETIEKMQALVKNYHTLRDTSKPELYKKLEFKPAASKVAGVEVHNFVCEINAEHPTMKAQADMMKDIENMDFNLVFVGDYYMVGNGDANRLAPLIEKARAGAWKGETELSGGASFESMIDLINVAAEGLMRQPNMDPKTKILIQALKGSSLKMMMSVGASGRPNFSIRIPLAGMATLGPAVMGP